MGLVGMIEDVERGKVDENGQVGYQKVVRCMKCMEGGHACKVPCMWMGGFWDFNKSFG